MAKRLDSINKNVSSISDEAHNLNETLNGMLGSYSAVEKRLDSILKLEQSIRDTARLRAKEEKKAVEDEEKRKKKAADDEARRKENERAKDRKYAEWEEQTRRQQKQTLKEIQQLREKTGKDDIEQYRALQAEERKLQQLINGNSGNGSIGGYLAKTASNAGKALLSASSNAISTTIDQFRDYTSNIATRLSGDRNTFGTMVGRISNATSWNGAVSASSVVSNLNQLVSSGIAYNVELRAYLATATDKIATTFNVFDSNLLRLIRLQKHDTTAAYLGMESVLTDLFNETFQDTSFLNKGGLSDAITGSIIEATSQMGYTEGLEFQYSVQKWLGALSESGATDSFVSTLVTALNMLGTGDVNGLSNNTQMQSLLALAANNAGLNYSDLLIGGLNASNTNALMYSLFNYLGGVSSASSGNNVLRNAFGNVFGFNMSDIQAVQNLLSSSSADIYDSMLSFAGAEGQTSKQLSTMLNRTSIYDRVQTGIENALFNIGSAVATNEVGSWSWAIGEQVDKLLGNPEIPGLGVDIGKLIQLGGAGIGGGLQAIMQTLQSGMQGGTASIGLGTLKGLLSGGGMSYGLGDTYDARNGNYKTLQTISGTSIADSKTIEDVYEKTSEIQGDTTKIDSNTKRGTAQNAPVFVQDIDRTELLNTIVENTNALKDSTFDVNIKSVSGDMLLPISINDMDDNIKAFFNLELAKNLAQRYINAIYNADANNADPNIDAEHTLGALAEFLVNVQSARGDYIDVNLADSSLTIKDMLVRRA